MFASLEWQLAMRYLKARRGFIALTSWFAIIGIMLGVATLILVTSLMNGIREEMTSRFIGLDGHITVYSNGAPFTDYQHATDLIESVKGIKTITAIIEGQVMATTHGKALGAQVLAMPYKALEQRALIADHLIAGSLESLKTENGILLGASLARNLGVNVGDEVTLISPNGRATAIGFIPRMKAYPVAAIVKLGMHAFDSSLIVMPYASAQSYFQMRSAEGDAVSNLEIMVHTPDNAAAIAARIKEKLGASALVFPWQETHASVFSALKVQRNVMVIILTLIILVAAFNIISSLVMLVKDKSHDIAILRTMGATKTSVMQIFMLTGTCIGLAGTFAGLVLGVYLAQNLEALHRLIERATGQELLVENIYFLSSLPTKTDPTEVLTILALSLALSFLATLYPARRAATLNPVEALRHE